METGIYEELVTQLVSSKIEILNNDNYYINKNKLDKSEASRVLSQHLSQSIKHALDYIKGENQIELQIEIANKIILFLKDELKKDEFDNDLIKAEGEILKAIFSKIDAHFSDIELHLKEITPYTRLTHSELFTGGNVGLSLLHELKKEILSSDRIDLLVSFIKFKGIIILEPELKEFTKRGGELRLITTTYMGASDYSAIKLLSELDNTTVKISYNTGNERLHAKAYLFYRKTGFHTGYIGSSNFSRSALTDGLEWNLKITTKEVSHIIEKFKNTFEVYWQSNDFDVYDNSQKEKLIKSLDKGKISKSGELNTTFFDVKPYSYQNEILEKLDVERNIHNRYKNLIVAATGTGKTIISAFDFKRFKKINKNARLLFIAHRVEILEQAKNTFQGVLRDNNFGELWADGYVPKNNENVFASVLTLNKNISSMNLSREYYDFIIIDECHHLTANSYRSIIEYFKPKIMLGLTATPERMDGNDILPDFHNRIAAEIRLPEALNRKLLCPFQYFGISDSIDLSNVKWEKGKYSTNELTEIYTSNDRRVGEIISSLKKYTQDIESVQAIGFCVSIEHAKYMAEKFVSLGLKASYITSMNTDERGDLRNKFIKKEINYLFVVDIYNEGVDIPEIDTVMFLRPTESLTIFLQQLGRGLRLSENKDCLTVLDFVGNARPEYKFENKFRSLIGKTTASVFKEIENNFPHLPLGCSIILEKKAREVILNNIKLATTLNKTQIIQKIINFKHNTSLKLSLKNFIEFYNIPLQNIYKIGTWSRLCQLAGIIEHFEDRHEKNIQLAIKLKWLSTSSKSYFEFILELAKSNFTYKLNINNEIQYKMLLMLHYDVWQNAGGFNSIEDSIKEIGKNNVLVKEIIEVLEILIDRIDHIEKDIDLTYNQPLKIHSRYTRDQILVAFNMNTFEKASSNRIGVGVAWEKSINTEILFINLIKSEENYSPTTMYNDYAINEYLFHWQSQNSAGPNTPKGQSYINHQKDQKRILLFVRENHEDQFGNTMGYVFLGDGSLKDHNGSKPMNIEWELSEPIPPYLWNDAAKLSIS